MSDQKAQEPAANSVSIDVDPSPATSTEVQAPELAEPVAASLAAKDAQGKRSTKKARKGAELSQEPLSEVMFRRLTRIKEGDTVLLRLPSDLIKSVVVQRDSLVQLGKYGAFPSSQLLGLHYDITYEITPSGSASGISTPQPQLIDSTNEDEGVESRGELKGKKGGKTSKGKGRDTGSSKNHLGWKNVLRPLKKQAVVDAVIDDIAETNEFIEDLGEAEKNNINSQEISELRAQGFTADELIQAQIAKHERFGLKTDFSKEKWRRRKEKKFYQTVHPLAPSIPNILYHYNLRSPQSILHLRDDTISQLLTIANVRPGGRYLVVDDTGGLVTAAVLERMGCEGRILLLNESDSPPPWGVLQTMNFTELELEPVKWLSWLEAEENYKKPAPPPPDQPPTNAMKSAAKQRRFASQLAELSTTRNELHLGGWDGLILATALDPISIVSRLSSYLLGSSPVVVYSPYIQVLAELLNWSKKDPQFLNDTLMESWERTYQVLPGRTHPMMTTSATGGYLWSAIKVHPSKYQPLSHSRFKRRKTGKGQGKEQVADGDDGANDEDSTDARGVRNSEEFVNEDQ